MRLLSSIFPEKLNFEENKSRTPKINEAVRLLLATDKDFNEKGTTQIFKNLELSPQVELSGNRTRCPNIFVKSFLHAYFIIGCRQ